jgi:hypothetical protein
MPISVLSAHEAGHVLAGKWANYELKSARVDLECGQGGLVLQL